jgi:hypothetical protein
MIVRAPSVELAGDEVVLVARFEPEGQKVRPGVLRLGVARAYGDWLDRSGTPLAPVATVLATAVGEDLRLEAPVSPALVEGAERVSARFAGWWGYRAIRIEAPEQDNLPPGPDVAALFSGGIDTSATLIRSLRGDIPERATHLISMYASEFKLSPETHEAIWRENAQAAAEYGLPLIRMTTNAPHLLRGRIAWPRSHGASFASLALLLGPQFSAVLFGSSQLPEETRPHGSRADLDFLWSTEATAIRHDAAELGKLGRAAVVATSPIAMKHLKVCWKRDIPGNCGRCEKCLRTMTCLEVAGALDRTDRFDGPLTLEAIRACEPTRNSPSLIRELVNHMPDEHADLRAAWREKLREAEARRRAHRRAVKLNSLRRRVRRAFRRTRRRGRRARRRLARSSSGARP